MSTVLMCKDEPVLAFDLDKGEYNIINTKLLPYELKGRISQTEPLKNGMTVYEIKQAMSKANKNYDMLLHYFASRTLPLSRENAKKIYNLFGYEQVQTDKQRALIAISCRSVSLQDVYWVKDEKENLVWNDVNIRTNSLSETVAQVSLHGSSLTLQGKEHTPELNGQGSYAKAWKRENNELYLYKLGTNAEYNESKIEVLTSNILDNMNVNHVKYEDAVSQNNYACKCKCMTTNDLSILSGMDFISYCNSNDINPYKEMMKIDEDSIYKMWIVDYLISNSDRHGMNWGFYYDSNTMEIKGCHPLYDHNNAFDKELMKNKNAISLFNDKKTMKEMAEYAIKKVDFHFYRPFTRKDFMTDEQYKSFMEKTKELNIQIKPITLDEKINSIKKEYVSSSKQNRSKDDFCL